MMAEVPVELFEEMVLTAVKRICDLFLLMKAVPRFTFARF